jgi:hypothetical protein
MNRQDFLFLLDLFLITTFIILLLTSFYIVGEIYRAQYYCKLSNGSYKIGLDLKHYCNGSEFVRFSDGWDYEMNRGLLNRINLTEILLERQR